MKIEMLHSKIHRARVTQSNINYEGSITIDKSILKKANLIQGQKVEIANINNGERFSTYIIEGDENSKCICINGAAARMVQVGDEIIIMAYAMYDISELADYKCTILLFDEFNNIKSIK